MLPSTQALAALSNRRSAEPRRNEAVGTPPGVVELRISVATKPRTVMVSVILVSCLEVSCPSRHFKHQPGADGQREPMFRMWKTGGAGVGMRGETAGCLTLVARKSM